MINRIRERLLAFINSDKDVPLLAGFSVGFYLIMFVYSRNFGIVNSWQQLLFFIGYYILLPMLCLYAGYKIAGLAKFSRYRRNFLFTGMIGFFAFYLLQINNIGFSKKIAFIMIVLIAAIVSFRIKKYYKLLIILLFLMSAFNIKPLVSVVITAGTASDEWKQQPDNIEEIVFKKKPNIYFIQPDGYTSFANLKDSIHNFDNSEYETFLRDNGFTLYDNYRSNYYSTLLSNSSAFSMKHHYIAKQVQSYEAREIIVGDNAVLKILKNNGYKASFITENPYLMINRPMLGYDYTNINYNDIPYLKDGFGISKDVEEDLFKQINTNEKSGNFYFVEKFSPGHIHVYEADSEGIKEEAAAYIQNLREANTWIKKVIKYIEKNDSEAIIIIGADHGGFAGFKNTLESVHRTQSKNLIYSIYGSHLAIKWNSNISSEYDNNLSSSVNLFRTVFSFLAEDNSYLDNLQDNSSYINLQTPPGKYKYIDNDGKVVFEKL